MSGDVSMLAWCDLAGVVRMRAVPTTKLDANRESGLGWPAGAQAMLPHGEIADNPWGPVHEVRQRPVDAEVVLPADGEWSTFHLVLTQSIDADGNPWECCPRAFCEGALAALEAETGWTLMSAFEFEFTQTDPRLAGLPVYSLDAFRAAAPFIAKAMAALDGAGLLPASVEPEYGAGQLEISTAVFPGIAGPDKAILTRELLREVSRRAAWPITFSPKVKPDSTGNGQHIHFSFVDRTGEPVLYDPASPALISAEAASFVAGIIDHMDALCAVAAPSPVSYLRLGPNHWSCGYNSFGLQNREVAVRVCPPIGKDERTRSRTINLEFRPADALSNPYLLVGMLIHAGLDGLRRKLPLPPMITSNPADLSAAERKALNVSPLPSSQEAALSAFNNDDSAKSWFPVQLYETFVSVRRKEQEICSGMSSKEICEYYLGIY